MSSALLLSLTACPGDKGGSDDGATLDTTTADTTTDTASATDTKATDTTDAADTTDGGATPTEDTVGTTEPTTGGPSSPDCECIEETSPSRFDVVCPADIKAEITGDCTYDDECTYDEAEIDAALAFLATGEPGVVVWDINGEPSALLPRSGDRGAPLRISALTGLAADCSDAFCTGGLHVVVDGKIYTQTIEQMDLSGQRSPLTGATLKDATFFTTCAQQPEVRDRFDCVKAAMTAPEFSQCAEGMDFDYY
jgi:hypothetical protein